MLKLCACCVCVYTCPSSIFLVMLCCWLSPTSHDVAHYHLRRKLHLLPLSLHTVWRHTEITLPLIQDQRFISHAHANAKSTKGKFQHQYVYGYFSFTNHLILTNQLSQSVTSHEIQVLIITLNKILQHRFNDSI